MTTRTLPMAPGTLNAVPGRGSGRDTLPDTIGTMGNRMNGSQVLRTGGGELTSTPHRSSGRQIVTQTHAHFGPIYPRTAGATTEYRAEIAATGLERGTVTAASVWIPGIRQVFPEGIDLLLMGPSGDDGLRFAPGSRRGDSTEFDLACSDAPAYTPLAQGSPGEVAVVRALGTGCSRLAACAPDESGHTSLSVLASTAPNGIWQLALFADSATQRVLFGGWCLTITAQIPA